MLFSSLIFLYLFLPITLGVYYLMPRLIKNYWLLFASLVFFAWGGASLTLLLVFSIVANYIFGIFIERTKTTARTSYRWLAAGVTFNLLFLGVFKYTNFMVSNLNLLSSRLHFPAIPATHILLPVGISFYTFHSLSYLVDIYRGKTQAQRNIFDLALYISMFSQLIAGPIIRYSDIWEQLRGRSHTLLKFSSGIERFLIGLAKKVLLANTFATVADTFFSQAAEELNALTSWLGIISYTFQIYYDFSGYSDMAIGLGRMFGFDFKENFDLPYSAASVQEFWRRWHMSLSSFFRDYVYIPLGGNQKGTSRTYLNLFLVFLLTGFWHGASWNFVVWGLFHGFFMIIERLGVSEILNKLWRPVSTLYMFLVVLFAWVLFRADDLTHALNYWQAMFDFTQSADQTLLFYANIKPSVLAALIVGVLGAFGFFYKMRDLAKKIAALDSRIVPLLKYSFHLLSFICYFCILFLCTMYLTAGTYNPFIYYKF